MTWPHRASLVCGVPKAGLIVTGIIGVALNGYDIGEQSHRVFFVAGDITQYVCRRLGSPQYGPLPIALTLSNVTTGSQLCRLRDSPR